jgi:hypothetical protein
MTRDACMKNNRDAPNFSLMRLNLKVIGLVESRARSFSRLLARAMLIDRQQKAKPQHNFGFHLY